jgi:hypothetical protein
MKTNNKFNSLTFEAQTMKRLIRNFLIFLSTLLLIFSLSSKSPADNSNSANGEWQYVIKRGDTKGRGGAMSNPNCPFYIGYFSLDFREFSKSANGQYIWQPDFMYAMKSRGSGSTMYAIGNNSYEIKGSYTPMDDDSYCQSPLTQVQGEKAPIRMVKVSPDGRNLEWITDFQQGNQGGNAIWRTKAQYDGSNFIKGILKAYICEGENEKRGCTLLNTATFEAKRVKSIQEASGKPLFQNAINNSPLTTLYIWISHAFDKNLHMSFAVPNSATEEAGIIPENYIRSSIKAVFPSFAMSPAYSATIGVEICRARGGTGSNPCKVCRNVGNCQNGQTPQEENVCCFGNCDGRSLCKVQCGGDLYKCITGCGQSGCV